jgi:hypothetical protein
MTYEQPRQTAAHFNLELYLRNNTAILDALRINDWYTDAARWHTGLQYNNASFVSTLNRPIEWNIEEFLPPNRHFPGFPGVHTGVQSMSIDGALQCCYGHRQDLQEVIERRLADWILDECRQLRFGRKRSVLGYILVWEDQHADFEELKRMLTELKV